MISLKLARMVCYEFYAIRIKGLDIMKFSPKYILVILFFSANVSATEIKAYPLKKIASNTYVIHGPLAQPNKTNKGFMNNPGFVVTQTGVVVVDPGSSVQVGRMVLKQIKTITQKPVTHVLNTHIHGDHWLGNHAFIEAFPKVVIMAHPDMIKRAKVGAKQWISLMSMLTSGETDGTRAVIPDKAVQDKHTFRTGGVEFRIYAPEKAHSFTDIMIEVVEESVVFLGDNVLYQRLPRMDDGSFKGNMLACQIAMNLGAKVYVPGHGQSGDKNIIIPFMNYLKIIYREVGIHTEAGLSDYEMKPKMLSKLQDYFNWFGFKDELGKHISLAVLEYERDEY
jgi:glyoxylase-like metal-dependent hydrolase (beta-lactamase superfamily II)